MDLGIEFPNDLRSEPAEEGSLDEALKAGAPSPLWSAPGESLDTAKELSFKFDAKEDAEIIQTDAAARERRRKCEVPRSLPLMNFLVVPLSKDVFVDITPAIVASNAGDDCDGDESETDDVCYSVRKAACLMCSMVSGLLPLAFYQLGKAAFVSSSSCLVRFLYWSSLTDLLSAPHGLCGESMTLPFGAKFDWLISFEFQAKVSKHLTTHSERAGYLDHWKPSFGSVFLKSVGTKSSFNGNLFVD